MSDPSPVVALDYSDPKRAAAEPVLRVVGWANTVLGGVAVLALAVNLLSPLFGRYTYPYFPGGRAMIAAALATAALELVAGVGLVRRATWGTRATAGWAAAAVVGQTAGIALAAVRLYGYRSANLGDFVLTMLESLASSVVPVAYAVLCGAVVWWRPEVRAAFGSRDAGTVD